MKSKEELFELLDEVIKTEEANQVIKDDYIDTLDFDCNGEWHQRFSKCEYKGVSGISNAEKALSTILSEIIDKENKDD